MKTVHVYTYFKNCGSIDVHPLRSCFKVRYNSKVETVFGSNCSDAILLLRVKLQPMQSDSNDESPTQTDAKHMQQTDEKKNTDVEK